ncbi:MAG: Txe/YoeB family addiction module toxin [Candidatus Kapaibacteriota bacterium]|jgi:toxin YoeB
MKAVYFYDESFDEYSDWAKSNPSIFERLRRLITETRREPFIGLGKPEPLKYGRFKGYWSRRITEEHRLVYKKVTDEAIIIVSCYNHYGEK